MNAFELDGDVGSFAGSCVTPSAAESGVRLERRRHRKKQRLQRKRRERAHEWRGR